MNYHQANLLNRYTLSIENTRVTLYHEDERRKAGSEPERQRVIQQEELFKIFYKTHVKLGHAGICVMWKGLREFLWYFKRNNCYIRQSLGRMRNEASKSKENSRGVTNTDAKTE
ncbi:unnamed protein product, partial [Mesorhabditis belari]|uniref:Integrase zinc-binding domain-containing protein n=1 Tax=Mesorhabditis belari TaxID=2138241 RepID=A0AAF3FME3_9BILA